MRWLAPSCAVSAPVPAVLTSEAASILFMCCSQALKLAFSLQSELPCRPDTKVLDAKKEYRKTRRALQQKAPEPSAQQQPTGPASGLDKKQEDKGGDNSRSQALQVLQYNITALAIQKPLSSEICRLIVADKQLGPSMEEGDVGMYVGLDPGLLPEIFADPMPSFVGLLTKGGCRGLQVHAS